LIFAGKGFIFGNYTLEILHLACDTVFILSENLFDSGKDFIISKEFLKIV